MSKSKQMPRRSLALRWWSAALGGFRQARARHASLLHGLAAVAMALPLFLTASAQAKPAPAEPVQPAMSSCGDISYPLVCAQGQNLVYRGKMLRLVGATLYPDVVLGGRHMRGSAWGSGEAAVRPYIDHWLDAARAAGLNTIRPTDFLVDVHDWHQATLWQNLDYVLAGARARGMFVIMDLSPFRNSMRKSGHFPYDAAAWNEFLDFVGTRYSGEEAIAYYAIAGEIEPNNGNEPTRGTPAQYVAFFRATIARLHAADLGHHLVATGGLNHLQPNYGIPWQTLFSLPGADLATLHVYSDSDRQKVLPAAGAWAARQLKPLIVEEFGFKQKLGDRARAKAFRDTYEQGLRHNAAGMVFWNLGPETSPGSYDVNPKTPAVWATVSRYSARFRSD